jgi:hypothetical protein
MLTGWTNANEKKFKSLYNQIIGHSIGHKESEDIDTINEDLDTGMAHTNYENRTKDQVYNLAKELEIDGRS